MSICPKIASKKLRFLKKFLGGDGCHLVAPLELLREGLRIRSFGRKFPLGNAIQFESFSPVLPAKFPPAPAITNRLTRPAVGSARVSACWLRRRAATTFCKDGRTRDLSEST